MCSEAKLPAGDQLIVEQVVLKLLADHSFHHLANDAQQRNWPVLSWISLGSSLVAWDDKGSLPLVRERRRVERDGIMDKQVLHSILSKLYSELGQNQKLFQA